MMGMVKCVSSEPINKCECGAQVCARCGACRREDRIFHSDCRSWGTIYRRHIWKWTPED